MDDDAAQRPVDVEPKKNSINVAYAGMRCLFADALFLYSAVRTLMRPIF